MRHILAALAVALLPATVAAQVNGAGGRTVPDSLFRSAQRLVMGGNGADGRALVDSLLGAARPGSADYAEALYWHAALAETAADAERGYLRLSIEYPLSPRTEDALIRLGQLELTRGNRQIALRRFERATSEFPDGPQRARTEMMIARIYIDGRQWAPGCAAVEQGQLAVGTQDVELRNQLTYLSRQCASAGITSAAGPADASGGMLAGPTADSTPQPVRSPTRVAARDSARTVTDSRPSRPSRPTRPADTARAPSVASGVSTAAPPRAVATPPRAVATPPRPPAASAAAPASTRAAARSTPRAPGFSVQVAAFDRTEPARDLAEKLRKEGWDARIDADAEWQRVRVGYFATRAEATALAKQLMETGVNGFVTGVGGR